MSNLVATICLLFGGSVLFSIAIASWQKGNLWGGLYWGIVGYVVIGIGLVLTYYSYIVMPANASVPSSSKGKAIVGLRNSRLIEPLAAGSSPHVEFYLGSGPVHVRGTITDGTYFFAPSGDPMPQQSLQYHSGGISQNFDLMPDEMMAIQIRYGLVLTQRHIDAPNAEQARLYLYGRGQYTDDYGRVYPLSYCLVWDKYAAGGLAMCKDITELRN